MRAGQLDIQYCLVGIKEKPSALAALQKSLEITAKQTLYLGHERNDLAVSSQVKLLISPLDVCRPLLKQADAVLNQRGGHGAVRELAERILKAHGAWSDLEQKGWRDQNN